MKILIVDDSATVRLMLKSQIKAAEGALVQVFEAGTAKEALTVFTREEPELVFLDMMLDAKERGLQVLQALLAHKPDTSVVVITALDEAHPDVVNAISQGAIAHLKKPIHAQNVRKVFQTVHEDTGRLRRL